MYYVLVHSSSTRLCIYILDYIYIYRSIYIHRIPCTDVHGRVRAERGGFPAGKLAATAYAAAHGGPVVAADDVVRRPTCDLDDTPRGAVGRGRDGDVLGRALNHLTGSGNRSGRCRSWGSVEPEGELRLQI